MIGDIKWLRRRGGRLQRIRHNWRNKLGTNYNYVLYFIHQTQIQIILLWRDQLWEILLALFSRLDSNHTAMKNGRNYTEYQLNFHFKQYVLGFPTRQYFLVPGDIGTGTSLNCPGTKGHCTGTTQKSGQGMRQDFDTLFRDIPGWDNGTHTEINFATFQPNIYGKFWKLAVMKFALVKFA